jgi:hypothetical protein
MFKTDHMGPAAYVLAHGYTLLKLESLNDPNRPSAVAFVLDADEEEGRRLYRQFYAGGTVAAQIFEQALIRLKVMLQERKASRPRQVLTPNYFPDGGAR